MKDFGSRLKDVRVKQGLKQADMPTKIGIGTQKTWSNYETEESFPSNEVFLKLVDLFNIDLHWLLTGVGSMFRTERSRTDKKFFEIPFLTKEQAMQFDHEKEITEQRANSGIYPDISLVPIPRRVLEYSTDLRAIEVFDSRMAPVMHSGDIAVIEATGWNGDGIYLYRMSGGLHISYAGQGKNNTFKVFNEIGKKVTYDAETFKPIGRVRAVVKDTFGFDWKEE